MKFGKKFMSLVLALVMIASLTVNASASDKRIFDETARLSPDITVTVDGKTQTMTDTKGNAVYPVQFEGSTYLPIRAVCDMLGLEIFWVPFNKTIMLVGTPDPSAAAQTDSKTKVNAKPADITAQLDYDIAVEYNGLYRPLRNDNNDYVVVLSYNGTNYMPVRAISLIMGVSVDWDSDTRTLALADTVTDTEVKTREIDYSTADDGYIRVRVNAGESASHVSGRCDISYTGVDGTEKDSYTFLPNRWVSIPLYEGTGDYEASIMLNTQSCGHLLTDGECIAIDDSSVVTAKFSARITDANLLWTASTPEIDFLNAPKTQAKALELTKNCKTDAEKITAVYNWVSSNIKYDQASYEAVIKAAQEWESYKKKIAEMTEEELEKARAEEAADFRKRAMTRCSQLNPNGVHFDGSEETLRSLTDLNPDRILDAKTGVCRHYAALMVAMLRSVGVQCKYVSGDMYTGKIIKDYSDDGWGGHAWVVVNPKTGTLNISGAGKDYASGTFENGKWTPAKPTSWIRLDPTNASNRALTSDDTKYRPDSSNAYK